MGEPDLTGEGAPRALAFRLAPGEDLRGALERRAAGLPAACVLSCVGSLARARLRLAGGERVLEVEGPLEIVSLVGTLSPDGVHLHVSVADADGVVRGGHLLPGSLVYTTAEIVLGEPLDLRFAREPDAATGWRELVIRPRD